MRTLDACPRCPTIPRTGARRGTTTLPTSRWYARNADSGEYTYRLTVLDEMGYESAPGRPYGPPCAARHCDHEDYATAPLAP